MNNDKFDEALQARIDKIKKVLTSKGSEYAKDNDRFYNAKRAAEIERCSPEAAIWGMAMKHLVSVIDIIEDVDKFKQELGNKAEHSLIRPEGLNKRLVEEKFGDLINYLIIIEAMIKDYFAMDD